MMERRRHARLTVEVAGSYRVDSGRARTVFLSQISEKGCRLAESECTLASGDRVELSLGPVGPMAGTVRWRHDDHAGVEFDLALEPAIVSYFAAFAPRVA